MSVDTYTWAEEMLAGSALWGTQDQLRRETREGTAPTRHRRSTGLGKHRTPRAHWKVSLYSPSLTVSLAFQNFFGRKLYSTYKCF